jgi:CheY-like chemotaxis protein
MTEADLFRFARAAAARLKTSGPVAGAQVLAQLRQAGLSAAQAADVVGFGVRRQLLRRDPVDPARLCAVQGAEHLPTPMPSTRTIRRPLVLVVDDDPSCNALVAELLDRSGYRAVSAANGGEALAMLDEGLRPAVIVADLMMPVMHGWDLLASLRSRPALASVQVVVTSAVHDPRRADLYDAVFLPKPLRLETLLAAVETACSGAASTRATARG